MILGVKVVHNISAICRKNGPQNLNDVDLEEYTVLLPGKKLDLGALIKAKKYKGKGNKIAAVAACKRLQEMELGVLHELGSSQGTPMVLVYMQAIYRSMYLRSVQYQIRRMKKQNSSEQVLMFYHLKTRRCVNTVLLQAS